MVRSYHAPAEDTAPQVDADAAQLFDITDGMFEGWITVPARCLLDMLAPMDSDTATITTFMMFVVYGTSYPPPFLTIEEIAAHVGLSEQKVRKSLNRVKGAQIKDLGGIPGYRLPKHYDPEMVARYEERRAQDRAATRNQDPIPLSERKSNKRRRLDRLVAKYNATCVYCKKAGTDELGPDGRAWHGDHVWAKAQGGRGGIVLACSVCNIRKHQLSAEDFLAKLAEEAANG